MVDATVEHKIFDKYQINKNIKGKYVKICHESIFYIISIIKILIKFRKN